MKKPIGVGDRVAYSAQFLRSTCQMTGTAGELRGEVIEIVEHTPRFALATVKWDGIIDLAHINVANLARVGSAGMSAQ